MGKKKTDKKSPGKKKSGKRSADGKHAPQVCGRCRNFKAGTGGAGMCTRHDKKRSADDTACGRFDPR